MKAPSLAPLLFCACFLVGCHVPPDGGPREARSPAPRYERGIEGLGRIDFPNTGPESAQAAFVRGVLLLHSFEYRDAAEAFREAQEAAPEFALAYWGEALTHCHPIWHQEDRLEALEVLARLAPTPEQRRALAGDERERELMDSVEILFGEGTRAARLQTYCKALERLHLRYPEDSEIAAFHALSILGTATQGRDISVYMRAAAVAEGVLERAPDHPGALHYAIHAFDDPVHAPLGLRMARRYGVVAAAAEHALHMPSHIYTALGLWDDSVEANIAAAGAADARRERKQLGVEARGFHSLHWLAYSHLQLGQGAEAERLLAAMIRDEDERSSRRTRFHLVAMRAVYVVALQSWESEIARFEVDLDELGPAAVCAELYVRGRSALARSDGDAARTALLSMEPFGTLSVQEQAEAAGMGQCCLPAGADYLPGRMAAHVMELELSGLVAIAAGAHEEGLARLEIAAEKEDQMGFDFGPPTVVEPAHELLGYMLLELGRKSEAEGEFEAALRRAPGRARSLQGLALAGSQSGS